MGGLQNRVLKQIGRIERTSGRVQNGPQAEDPLECDFDFIQRFRGAAGDGRGRVEREATKPCLVACHTSYYTPADLWGLNSSLGSYTSIVSKDLEILEFSILKKQGK
ncbi:hypothetical protein QCA50_000872 [Cerrena zonata]|uniref:Uncharacterized protein n=1 Tax=Cerrena zonata TaxID=2478898 RepID=A0AAW0H0J0_9APHY